MIFANKLISNLAKATPKLSTESDATKNSDKNLFDTKSVSNSIFEENFEIQPNDDEFEITPHVSKESKDEDEFTIAPWESIESEEAEDEEFEIAPNDSEEESVEEAKEEFDVTPCDSVEYKGAEDNEFVIQPPDIEIPLPPGLPETLPPEPPKAALSLEPPTICPPEPPTAIEEIDITKEDVDVFDEEVEPKATIAENNSAFNEAGKIKFTVDNLKSMDKGEFTGFSKKMAEAAYEVLKANSTDDVLGILDSETGEPLDYSVYYEKYCLDKLNGEDNGLGYYEDETTEAVLFKYDQNKDGKYDHYIDFNKDHQLTGYNVFNEDKSINVKELNYSKSNERIAFLSNDHYTMEEKAEEGNSVIDADSEYIYVTRNSTEDGETINLELLYN